MHSVYYFLSLSSPGVASVLGKRPKARTSSPSSVLRRRVSSSYSSQIGFTQYIVSCLLQFGGVSAYQCTAL